MGKPAICSRLPMVERTFAPGTISTYEPGNPDQLCAAILAVVDDPIARAAAVERARTVIAGMAWERESVAYVALVERLITASRG
jgi:hypothetical protein